MINSDSVFDAVRRGYNELGEASNADIENYFAEINPEAMVGHISNIKGILFELQYVEKLDAVGIHAEVFEAANHPAVDIAIFEGGEVVKELQLKATESVAYVNTTLEQYPDIPIVVTTEVASHFESELIIDSGIEEALLESVVTETLLDEVVNPISPFSVISWFFGLPF
jgi:DNA-binding NarL/FixJ family response regulator